MKVLEKERIYSDAQRKNARQSELDLSLKALHSFCTELEMAKRNLNKQVQQNNENINFFRKRRQFRFIQKNIFLLYPPIYERVFAQQQPTK